MSENTTQNRKESTAHRTGSKLRIHASGLLMQLGKLRAQIVAFSAKAGSARAEQALQLHANPFLLPARTIFAGFAAAILLSALVYFALVERSSARLARDMAANDSLSAILKNSPFYGGADEATKEDTLMTPEAPAVAATKIVPGEVNDLAIATWIRQLKLVPADSDVKSILEDERLALLLSALRHGSGCSQTETDRTKQIPRLPLSAPTIDRLIDIARYLADSDCATPLGDDGRDPLVGGLVSRIAGLEPLADHSAPSCANLARLISVPRRKDGRDADVLVPVGCVSYFAPVVAEGGKQVVTWLFSESGVYRNARTAVTRFQLASKDLKTAEEKLEAKKLDLVNAQKELTDLGEQPVPTIKSEVEARVAEANRIVEVAQADADARRKIVEVLQKGPLSFFDMVYKARIDENGALEFEDGPLRAIEEFAIALVASIDADPDVSESRLWISVWRGYEQFAIIVLAAITFSLLALRFVSFQDRGRDIDNAVKEIEKLSIPVADLDEQSKGKLLSVAKLRAESLRNAKLHEPPPSSRPGAEIRVELVDAALTDLSQLSRYGLTIEHLEQTAEDLKDKLATSRIAVDWAIAALPAIGFIGTVRGILNALSDVGGLSQGDAAARLQTLLQVSGSLGLAFATTLLALIAMLLLSYVDVRQTRSERNLVDQFRDYLAKKVLS